LDDPKTVSTVFVNKNLEKDLKSSISTKEPSWMDSSFQLTSLEIGGQLDRFDLLCCARDRLALLAFSLFPHCLQSARSSFCSRSIRFVSSRIKDDTRGYFL
jgi:hypothetical protein